MADRAEYEGQQLGNYRLLRLLGQGGFAEVYLAEHVHLKTLAAVKLLMARLAQDDIEKFRSEAQTIARLIHPNIVRVLDFGVERNIPYLAMDYAPNGTLRSRHPKGSRVPLEAVVSYVGQITEALQYAHDQHLIHRDVKPENMLLGRNNEVLLSDFGIALVTQSSRYPTSTQDVAGTISYMAPEQIQAHPRPASDQYSLGIVVYEWLSGNRPFQGSFTEIAAKHTLTLPPPLRGQLPSLSPAVESVVMTALNKDPAQRFPTIRVFAQALQEASLAGAGRGASSFSTDMIAFPPSPYANGAPQPSPYANIAPPPPVSSPKPQIEPKPLALQYDPAAPSNPLPYDPAAPAYPSNATPSYQPVPSWAQAQPQKRLGRRAIVAGMIGLAAVASSGLTWFISQQKTAGLTISSLGNNPLLRAISTSASNLSTSTSALLTYSRHTELVQAVQWSPDGKLIASCSLDGTTQVWSADNGQRMLSYHSNSQSARSNVSPNAVAWSPDSKHIAIAFDDGTAHIADVASGNTLASYNVTDDPLQAIAWSPDGKYILVGSFFGTAWVYDVTVGSQAATFSGDSGPIYSVAWSPDGGRVAVGTSDEEAEIWNPLTGQELLKYQEHTAQVHTLAWSPDSKRVVSGSWDGTAHIWDATTGNTLYKYTKHEAPEVNAVAWSPDGKSIASGSLFNTHIWDANTGSISKHYDSLEAESISWSPDSTRIVTGASMLAQVWNAK